MVNFPTQITNCYSHSPALLLVFLSSDACICSIKAFPPLGNSDHVVVSASIDFPSYLKQDALFNRIAYDYTRADWDSLCDHLRDVLRENICKLSASTAARFLAACAAAIVHRNYFFHLYQKDKSSESKVKFRQASNLWKRVLEAAKLAYANKTE